MQHLENDMDDLFRRAANNYPLNTGAMDWSKVASAIAGSEEEAAAPKRSRRKYLSLLFLIPLLAGVLLLFKYRQPSSPKINITLQSAVPQQQTVNNSALPQPALKPEPVAGGKLLTEEPWTADAPLFTISHPTRSLMRERKPASNTIAEPALPVKTPELKPFAEMTLPAGKAIFISNRTHTLAEEKMMKNQASMISMKGAIPSSGQLQSAGAGNQKRNQPRAQRGFYLMPAGGPQFNQVKRQGFQGAGFSLGLTAGYRISKRLRLETGLHYANKKYFSDGQYFNMNKIGPGMPTDMKVIGLNGRLNILEIPLQVKYEIASLGKTRLIAGGGINSYILLKEKNKYQAMVNGLQQKLDVSYAETRNYFAADFQFSIGFEKTLGNHKMLRVEPYLRVPTKGLGIGSMTLSGAGLQIGLILPIRK